MVMMKRIIFIFILLVMQRHALAFAEPGPLVSEALTNVSRQLDVPDAGAPTAFILFGMPAAFLTLDIPMPVEIFLKRLHGRTSMFTHMTRVGNQMFYTGSISASNLTLQLVVDLATAARTQAILSVIEYAADTQFSPDDPERYLPARRRGLQLLPEGGRLLMDICFGDPQHVCHQVYSYAHTGAAQLSEAFRRELLSAKWNSISGQGIDTWVRYGLSIRFFVEDAQGTAVLYLAASDALW